MMSATSLPAPAAPLGRAAACITRALALALALHGAARAQSPAPCAVPGAWTDAFGGVIVVRDDLTGTVKYPYCANAHQIQVSLAGTTGFSVAGSYAGADCQGFSQNMLFAPNCSSASGQYVNNDGSHGDDTWVRTPLSITLARDSLTRLHASGTPSGGTFAYNMEPVAGANLATIAPAAGSTPSSNPNVADLVAPAHAGAPSPGGLATLVARYTSGGASATDNLNKVATFGMSCYMIALESDYGTPPSACAATVLYGVRHAGTVTDPNGLTGTYCAAFIENVKLQGSAQLNSGGKIQYKVDSGTFVGVTDIKGADGTPLVAGRTVARDPAVVAGAALLDVDGVGSGLLANDKGGAIKGYRLDLFNGAGKAACRGYANPIAVGVCQSAQPTCPERTLK